MDKKTLEETYARGKKAYLERFKTASSPKEKDEISRELRAWETMYLNYHRFPETMERLS